MDIKDLDRFYRHSHVSVLDIANRVHNCKPGNAMDWFNQEHNEELKKWLRWRLDNWQPTVNPANLKFDSLVRSLVEAALEE